MMLRRLLLCALCAFTRMLLRVYEREHAAAFSDAAHAMEIYAAHESATRHTRYLITAMKMRRLLPDAAMLQLTTLFRRR